MENLLSCNGVGFTARIGNRRCRGVISVENNCVYLCQNSIPGSDCSNKFGFDYSWSVLEGTASHLRSNDVTEFVLDNGQSLSMPRELYVTQKFDNGIEILSLFGDYVRYKDAEGIDKHYVTKKEFNDLIANAKEIKK